MARICYIGNFVPEYSTENDVRKSFEYLGHEVIQLQENRLPPSSAIKLEGLDLVLITSTWDNAIDLKQWIEFVKECADMNILTTTLHLDTFWSTSRGGRKWWLNPMFHTAYIFTADGDYQDKWKAFGKNHIWLPPAVRHDACHFGKFRKEYECDVAFVGSNGVGYHEKEWPYRKELLHNLRRICKKNNWTFKNPGGDDPKISRGEDLNDFYASAKVVVGDSLCLKKENSRYWSDRVPETTGRGGFLIMPNINKLQDFWPGLFMYDWGNWEQLEHSIKLNLEDEEGRRKINKLLQEDTAKNHTYVNRVQTILKEVGLDES